MKNKKIISRVLAIFAVLVLMVSMALPVFADEETLSDAPAYVISVIEFTDRPSLYSWLLQNYDKVIRATAYMASNGDVIAFSRPFVTYDGAGDTVFKFTEVLGDLWDDNMTAQVTFAEIGNTLRLCSGWLGDPADIAPLYDEYWPVVGLRIEISYLNELVSEEGSSTPVRSGMFGQLYYILRDALFGKNVVLDSAQDFTLTQISTWLTYIVILLPIIVIAIFLWRVFAR